MKLLLVIFFFLLIFCFHATKIFAQSQNDIVLAKTLFTPKAKDDFKQLVKVNKNEIESTFSVMFMFYKNFISSQDIDACIFQPSCSVYAIECIHHEKSKITASFKISDRIMRCHPLVLKGSYSIDKKTGKYFDPIED